MTINISDVIVTIGQQNSTVKEVLIPLLSVLVGGLVTYFFQIQLNKGREHKEAKAQLVIATTHVNALKNELEKIKEDIRKNNENIIKKYSLRSFEELDKVKILYRYNAFFPLLIEYINKNFKDLLSAISKHNKHIKKYEKIRLIIQFIPQYKKTVEKHTTNIIRIINETVANLSILQEKLENCDIRYISYKSIKDDVSSNNLKSNKNKNNSKYSLTNVFEKHWELYTIWQKITAKFKLFLRFLYTWLGIAKID